MVGTSKYSPEELDEVIRLHSGGLGVSASFSSALDSTSKSADLLYISSNFLDSDSRKYSSFMFDLIPEILMKSKWDNIDRIKTVISGMKSDAMNSLAGSGHMYAMQSSVRAFSDALSKSDRCGGMTNLAFLNSINVEDQSKLKEISQNLKVTLDYLILNLILRIYVITFFWVEHTSRAL